MDHNLNIAIRNLTRHLLYQVMIGYIIPDGRHQVLIIKRSIPDQNLIT